MVHHGFLMGVWFSSPLVECLELFSKTFQTRLKTLTHQWWKNMAPVWVVRTRVTSRIMSDIFPINWRRISGTAPDFHEMLLLLYQLWISGQKIFVQQELPFIRLSKAHYDPSCDVYRVTGWILLWDDRPHKIQKKMGPNPDKMDQYGWGPAWQFELEYVGIICTAED